MKELFVIEIEERAKIEIADAYDFYENRKKGLGEKFLKAVDGIIEYIKKAPEGFEEVRFHRQVPMKKFPYVILYEKVGHTIFIDAVFHTSRNPLNKPK